MVQISEQAQWVPVTRIEPTTIALGGDEVNSPNLQFKQLVDRTKFLKDRVDTITQISAFQYEISQNAHGLSVRDPVRFDGTQWVKSRANVQENAVAVGLIIAVPNANTFILSIGFCDGLYGFTPGLTYFVDDDGGLSEEPGTIVLPVFHATSTTTGWFTSLFGLNSNTGGGGGGGGSTGVGANYSTIITLGG